MSHQNRWQRQSGVALVEILVALAILAVVVLGIASLFLMSVKSNATGFDHTSINDLARDKFEQLISLPATDLALRVPVGSSSYVTTNDLPAYQPDPATGMPGTLSNPYRRTYTVEELKYTYDPATGTQAATVVNGGSQYDVKRITVALRSTRPGLIGLRALTITGYIRNPNPAGNTL